MKLLSRIPSLHTGRMPMQPGVLLLLSLLAWYLAAMVLFWYALGTGSVSCNSVFVRYLGRFLNQEELMEPKATVQNP